jgi:membrane protease YdiL (CAAX protease family)
LNHPIQSLVEKFLWEKAYLLLYCWVFAIVWATVHYSLTGIFTIGTILPVYGYLRCIDSKQPVQFLKLDRDNLIAGSVWGGILAGTFFIILAMKVYVDGQGPIYYHWPLMDIINIVIGASLVEEIFFRGFLLQKLMETTNFAKANIVATLLFALLHFPVWLADGLTIGELSESLLYLLGFSWVLGYSFHCSQSLWTPIILHAANNYFKLATISVQYLSSSW